MNNLFFFFFRFDFLVELLTFFVPILVISSVQWASSPWSWPWKPHKLYYRRARVLRCWYAGTRACIAEWRSPSVFSVPSSYSASSQLPGHPAIVCSETLFLLWTFSLSYLSKHILWFGSLELSSGPSNKINKTFLIP